MGVAEGSGDGETVGNEVGNAVGSSVVGDSEGSEVVGLVGEPVGASVKLSLEHAQVPNELDSVIHHPHLSSGSSSSPGSTMHSVNVCALYVNGNSHFSRGSPTVSPVPFLSSLRTGWILRRRQLI